MKSLLDDLLDEVVPPLPSFSNWSPVVLCLVAGLLLFGIRNPLQVLVVATNRRIPDRTETIFLFLIVVGENKGSNEWTLGCVRR